MSNPISTLPTSTNANSDELEIDELEVIDSELGEAFSEADSGARLTESGTDEASENAEISTDSDENAGTEKSRSYGLLALVLALLLLASIAINLKQSGDVATLAAQTGELSQALDAAVERIDTESARATRAESALDRVDNAVDLVNERVLGLQEALDGLREATIR